MSVRAIIVVAIALLAYATAGPMSLDSTNRTSKSLRFPWPIGNYCNGCPPHFCEADPAIVLGYCCGCRRLFDILPVVCTGHVACPLEISGVCHDYEYMLHCCC